jgi:hypothetical protein
MEAPHDFEALRARRNAALQEHLQKMADEWGMPLQTLCTTAKPFACYCACGTGGPCEHKWDGEGWESEDGCAWSATCSRCGCTAMSHDMRNAP